MARKKPTVSTAAVVRDHIDTHPSVKDGMRMGIMPALPSQRASGSGVLRTPYGRDDASVGPAWGVP